MLKLELNKTYVTRNGSVVKITVDDKDMIRRFGGHVPNRGSCFFTEQGQYILGRKSEFDIIKELE